MPAEPTAEQWRHMDGTSAWLTIDMHAVNMEDTGRLMGEWLAANQTEKSPPTLRPVG
jgi:sarcosine oxidase delta subunit